MVIFYSLVGGGISIIMTIIAKLWAENLFYILAVPAAWVNHFTGWGKISATDFANGIIFVTIINTLFGGLLFALFSIFKQLAINRNHGKPTRIFGEP